MFKKIRKWWNEYLERVGVELETRILSQFEVHLEVDRTERDGEEVLSKLDMPLSSLIDMKEVFDAGKYRRWTLRIERRK